MSIASAPAQYSVESALRRVAVLPVRIDPRRGSPEIALTRRRGGAWGLIEEWGINGIDDVDAARRAAFDSGGIGGEIEPVPIGAYLRWTNSVMPAKACIVDIFLMRARYDDKATPWLGGGGAIGCEWLSVEAAIDRLGDADRAPLLRMAAALVASTAGIDGEPLRPCEPDRAGAPPAGG